MSGLVYFFLVNFLLPFLSPSMFGDRTLTLLIMVPIDSMSGTLLMSSFSRSVPSGRLKNKASTCFTANKRENLVPYRPRGDQLWRRNTHPFLSFHYQEQASPCIYISARQSM